MTILFKVGMALVFSVIAALVVFLTGIFSDARIATAFLRSIVAFICAGAFTYLIVFILEAKGWAAFDKDPQERMQDMQAQYYQADDIDFDARDDAGASGAEEFAAPANFQPLSEESLVHMRTPSDTDEQDDGAPAPV